MQLSRPSGSKKHGNGYVGPVELETTQPRSGPENPTEVIGPVRQARNTAMGGNGVGVLTLTVWSVSPTLPFPSPNCF